MLQSTNGSGYAWSLEWVQDSFKYPGSIPNFRSLARGVKLSLCFFGWFSGEDIASEDYWRPTRFNIDPLLLVHCKRGEKPRDNEGGGGPTNEREEKKGLALVDRKRKEEEEKRRGRGRGRIKRGSRQMVRKRRGVWGSNDLTGRDRGGGGMGREHRCKGNE